MVSIEHAARAIARAIATDSPDRQPAIAQKWQSELMAGFLNGTLRVLDTGDRTKIPPDRPGSIVGAVHVGAVTRDELNRWLTARGTPVTIGQKHFTEAPAPGSADSAIGGPTAGLSWRSDPYWRNAAHEQANRIAQRNVQRGYGGTSQRDVMVDVATELRKDSRFPARDVDPQTVRRVLLKGWKWRHIVVAPTARAG
ncbi:hypothetical protein [Burkholderia cepacia]|uniref:hypothetical protein n=1 Tax=Burkholderia cepacia TaxID=292 RepID=UPI0012DA987E|nr:hypothetical protein [Burkholderia cepacia]